MLASDIAYGAPMGQTVEAADQMTDDHELLNLVACGDGQAFETLYDRYMHRVRSYLLKRLNDPDGVDEVLNDVMIVIWKKARACPANVPLLAWLYGIARYTASSYTRRLKLHEVEPNTFISVEEDPEFHLLMTRSARTHGPRDFSLALSRAPTG